MAEPDREGLGEALLLAQLLATMLLLRRALGVRDNVVLGHCVVASEGVCGSVPERLAVELALGCALPVAQAVAQAQAEGERDTVELSLALWQALPKRLAVALLEAQREDRALAEAQGDADGLFEAV